MTPTLKYHILSPNGQNQWEKLVSFPEGQLEHARCFFESLTETTTNPLALGCECGSSAILLAMRN